MEPQVIQCSEACTVTVQHEIPLLSIGAGEGAEIGWAIVMVWATAWGIRQLIRLVKADDSSNSKEDS